MKNSKKYLIIALLLFGFKLFAQNAVLVENSKVSIVNLGGDNYTIGSNAELKITNPVSDNGTVNLTSDSGWLILDGVTPSRALIFHINYITVNGQAAVNNVNVRITNYLRGCVIIPHSPTYEALTLYKESGYAGDEMKCFSYKYYKESELGSFNNEVSSFKLKKGYMATFAQNENGTGYSKVFIAESQDIQISTLQTGLNNKVSFVRVFPWRYTEKKGMGWGIKSPIQALRGSWFYNWGPFTSESLLDIEYVPMKWSAWRDVDSQWQTILNNNTSNHLLGFNEPDAATQANMSLDLMLLRWPKMMESGMRLGSPAPAGNTQLLYDFISKCDELNYRVDFVAIHDYGEGTAQAFYNKCKTIYDKTGRPIWVTEFNFGGTWTPGRPTYAQSAARIKEIIERYDKEGIIERYAIFNFDESDQNRAVFYNPVEDLNITPLGVAYRDQTSVMAFNPLEQINIPVKLVAPQKLKVTNKNSVTNLLEWENFNFSGLGTTLIERSYNGAPYSTIAQISSTESSYDDDITTTGFGRYIYRLSAREAGFPNSKFVIVDLDFNPNIVFNIALNKPATASSTLSTAYPASNAVDGNITDNASRWVNERGTVPAILEIDLQGSFFISQIKIFTGNLGSNNPLINFTFDYWNENTQSWITVVTETNNAISAYSKNFTEVQTNKVRLYINAASTDNTVRLFELEVYGRIATLGTNDFSLSKFNIYPNPTSIILNISGDLEIKNLQIFDVNGKQLITKKSSKSVDVSSLPVGNYFMKINNTETIKFIKK